MIQDIFPKNIRVEYENKAPDDNSIVICFHGQTVLVKENTLDFPKYSVFEEKPEVDYLFKIDEQNYFLALSDVTSLTGYIYDNTDIFRNRKPGWLAFAGITAMHLYGWYNGHKFCGRCGKKLVHDKKERMLFCDTCACFNYPNISPCVIVGIIDGENFLLTRYSGRAYKKYALVAGYIEVGETAEDAVRREVMEEVGLKIKNIKYYKSQPWGFSRSLLLGYFAELDGSAEITLDKNELEEAVWVKRNEIDVTYDDFSLTNDMICQFKDGTIK